MCVCVLQRMCPYQWPLNVCAVTDVSLTGAGAARGEGRGADAAGACLCVRVCTLHGARMHACTRACMAGRQAGRQQPACVCVYVCIYNIHVSYIMTGGAAAKPVTGRRKRVTSGGVAGREGEWSRAFVRPSRGARAPQRG